MLEGKTVCLKSDVRIEGNLPKGLIYADEGDIGIHITTSDGPDPFVRTLRLIPKQMTIGIGCRRGTDVGTIERHVLEVLMKNDISLHSLRAGGSIDLKKDEKGLLSFFKRYGIPATFFSKEELERIKGKFTDSEYVKSITGVGNVCERAAIAASDSGELIVRKDSKDGVTVAIAKEHPVIRFGDDG
jgi:cobalt-precorrin 5A hydrolase